MTKQDSGGVMIVVGVDGSRTGLEAAGWAAREAHLRGSTLRVVHAMAAWASEPVESGRLAEVGRWMREGGTTVLAAGVDRARHEAPDLTVDSALLPGDPREALIVAAREAELLVVGNHGLGGFRGLLLGSVAYGVAGHAPSHVAVVREQPALLKGEVVVGVDGSPASAGVMELAVAEAELRGAALRVVHAWTLLPPGGPSSDVGVILKEAVAVVRERHPGLKVVEEAVQGHPVEVLRQASEGADLLVIGSRGRGGLTGMLLGSVSHAMLQHATCPLIVART